MSAILQYDQACSYSLQYRSGGCGPEAQFISKAQAQSRNQIEKRFEFHPRNAAKEELFLVYAERQRPNWNGYDAEPVSAATYRIANKLLELLPIRFSLPTFGADPDGDITFEWFESNCRVLSVSISSKSELHYAAIVDSESFKGKELFFDTFPKRILELIARIYSA